MCTNQMASYHGHEKNNFTIHFCGIMHRDQLGKYGENTLLPFVIKFLLV